MFSFNAAKKMATCGAALSLLEDVEMHEKNWWCLHISECDGHLGQAEPLELDGHLVLRHYPGPGSIAFMVIINKKYRSLLRDVKMRNRCCRIQFQNKHYGFSQVFIGCHLAHGDRLAHSLIDAAYLTRTAIRLAPVVLCGDLNVDMLPALSHDPFCADLGRSKHHACERAALAHFSDPLGFEVIIPSMIGSPGGSSEFLEACMAAPISRVPLGDERGRPSLLDYSLGKGCKPTSVLIWDRFDLMFVE